MFSEKFSQYFLRQYRLSLLLNFKPKTFCDIGPQDEHFYYQGLLIDNLMV